MRDRSSSVRRGRVLLGALLAAAIGACADATTAPLRAPADASAHAAHDVRAAAELSLSALVLSLSPTSIYSTDFVEAFDIYRPEIAPDSLFWLKPPRRWRPVDLGAALPMASASDTAASAYSPFYGDVQNALGDWAIVKHDRDDWEQMQPTSVWHNPTNCAAPPQSHTIASYDESTYLCRNHMMTAVNARGYGVTYLTPNRMVDLSSGTATVRFDVATLRTTKNDWIDLWITPYDDNLVTPLDEELKGVDLQGEPRRGLHIRMSADDRNVSAFKAYFIYDHKSYPLPVATTAGLESKIAQSATARRRFELRLTPTSMRFGMVNAANPAQELWWIDTALPNWVGDIGIDRAVVQIGHHSLNPAADGGTPTTWHWDNIGISPAIPFTIVNADRRFATAASPSLTLRSSAPANARLRFAAHGRDLQVSFDGGSWRSATLQRQELNLTNRFRSYWMPIPAGTRTVRFRGSAASGFAKWFVRDVSVWAGGPVSSDETDDDDDDD